MNTDMQHDQPASAPVPVWDDGEDYTLVAPGEYIATIVRVGAPKWTQWRRWNITVTYELDSGERVPGYYSLGTERAKPKVGRQCRYWNLYQAALGTPPAPGPMPPELLLRRQVRITIKTSKDGRYSSVATESALDAEVEHEPEGEGEHEGERETDYLTLTLNPTLTKTKTPTVKKKQTLTSTVTATVIQEASTQVRKQPVPDDPPFDIFKSRSADVPGGAPARAVYLEGEL